MTASDAAAQAPEPAAPAESTAPAESGETAEAAAVAPDPLAPFDQAVVEGFFGVIGAPDDPAALAGADEALARLDAALAATRSGG